MTPPESGEACGPFIRESAARDLDAILALYPLAFPEEELRPLVSDLMDGTHDILSLVADAGEAPVGHILFSRFDGAALLGPLGVVPEWQGRGIGGWLVRAGLKRLDADGTGAVFVLGNPAYYGRLGFRRETAIMPPYDPPEIWRDAWQSLRLSGRAAPEAGNCTLPAPWMKPELWRP